MQNHLNRKYERRGGKSTTAVNLGIGLAKQGKKVLLLDCDSQGSLTASLGFRKPSLLEPSIATVMASIIEEDEIQNPILHHSEGVDLVPANETLKGVELALVNVMSRELILKEYVAGLRPRYDYILLDCAPSLGLITINALACADSVLIPVLCETFCYAHHSSGPGMFICLNPKNDTHNVYLNPQSFASSSSSSQSGSSISLSSSFFSIAFRN